MLPRLLSCFALFIGYLVLPAAAQPIETVPVIGGPCEGCEAVFVGIPDTLESTVRIAPDDEPGEPMVITGTVYDADGDPAAGVIVYAYQTNAEGRYAPDERLRGTGAYRHGALRGFAVTDAEGGYRFDTIRPGGYPGRDDPQHVHQHVIEPGCCTYWVTSIVFDDDPRLTAEYRSDHERGRGGASVTSPERDGNGVWRVERDIHLGLGVPGYQAFVADHPRDSG